MSSSASFVAVPFDADMVAILIVVVTALDADADDANDAVDRAAASASADPFSKSKIKPWRRRRYVIELNVRECSSLESNLASCSVSTSLLQSDMAASGLL